MILAARFVVAVLVAAFVLPAGAAEPITIHIAMARALSGVSTMAAIEKGYFREAGIEVVVDDLDSSANALFLLAQNKVQMVEGGVSAGYFNALEKGLPITIIADRATSPLGHKLIVRKDLEGSVKSIKDLEGRTIASNANGSVTSYEVEKILKGGGLTVDDIEFKIMGFPAMTAALANGSVDAALVIPPFSAQIPQNGLGFVLADPDDYADPKPVTLSVVFVNTEFAAQHPDVMRAYMKAYLRGVREYCQAYHNGPNRAEIVDLAVRTGAEPRRVFIEKFPWQARNPLGNVNLASLEDMQKFYIAQGMATAAQPASRLFDHRYIDAANAALGPFKLDNDKSPLPGCR